MPKIYTKLSNYQLELLIKGGVQTWEALDEDQEPLFEHKDINKVIEFSKDRSEVTYIASYVKG